MPLIGIQPQTELFFETIWGTDEPIEGDEHYVYVAFGRRNNQKKIVGWERKFYSWPAEESQILQDIEKRKAEEEVYFCPSLLRQKDAHKSSVKGSWVFWVDLDDGIPTDLKGLPEPTIKIESSDGHQHWYWRVDSFNSSDVTEGINRSFVLLLDGDKSGWDSSQVLRPPNTFNHKRSRSVNVLSISDASLPVGLFQGLPEPPPVDEIVITEILPDVTEIVFKYKFPPHVYKLFTGTTGEGKRSTSLMSLSYALAELNLTNEEMLALLLNAADRWGKFTGRPDKLDQLKQIVSIARRKYPYFNIPEDEQQPLKLIGFQTLLASEIHLEWVWRGWLQEAGYMLLASPPGVGKTQVSLDVAGHFALGKNSLGREVTKPRKIGFLSLEMGLADLKEFMLLLAATFTPEEQEILQQNFLILPLGEPLYMNRRETQESVEQMIGDYKLDGVMIDSLSSTTEGELKDEGTVKELMDWNDRIRQRLNCFTWIIHHMRKATSTNKKPNKLSDIYGPYVLTARATSVFALWETALPNAIEVIPLKVRLSPKPPPFYIRRNSHLHFETIAGAAVAMTEAKALTPIERSSSDVDIQVVDEPINGESNRTRFTI